MDILASTAAIVVCNKNDEAIKELEDPIPERVGDSETETVDSKHRGKWTTQEVFTIAQIVIPYN